MSLNGGVLVIVTFFDFFLQNIDFWGPRRFLDPLKVWGDTLEHFWKIPKKNFSINLFSKGKPPPWRKSLLQKMTILGAEITQNGSGGQKMRFFKVRDIDTIIEPGEKEHQTDVSSALKRFGDHPSRFWGITKFWTPALRFGPLLDFPYQNGSVGIKITKVDDYLKIDWGGHQTFLGPK